LLELGGFRPTSEDENGYTPIHAAASWGRVDLLRLLLERVASTGAEAATAAANIGDEDGDTPLPLASGAGNSPVLRPLLLGLRFLARPQRHLLSLDP